MSESEIFEFFGFSRGFSLFQILTWAFSPRTLSFFDFLISSRFLQLHGFLAVRP